MKYLIVGAGAALLCALTGGAAANTTSTDTTAEAVDTRPTAPSKLTCPRNRGYATFDYFTPERDQGSPVELVQQSWLDAHESALLLNRSDRSATVVVLRANGTANARFRALRDRRGWYLDHHTFCTK